jgi:phage shock protein PspC (stress-responsive transcriptional regulator)
MNCNEAMTALVASLEEGTPMTPRQREHVRTCERCGALLESAKQVQSQLEQETLAMPRLEDAVAAAEGELIRARTRRTMFVIFGICVALVAAVLLTLLLPVRETWDAGSVLWIIGMAGLISAGFFIPILGVLYLLRGFGRRRIYKRLKPGRQVSGVCLGLAEKLNADVNLIRAIFVLLLLFGGGIGFWAYIAFDAAMPVHPDDRRYMRRFQFQRWLARRRSDAGHHAR